MAFHLWRRFLSAISLIVLETSGIKAYVQPINAYYVRPAKDFSVACSNYALEREGRYICMENGQIRCLAGWKDEEAWCQIPICGPQCTKPNGDCHAPGNCVCEIGYYGEECEHCNLLPGCIHGNCSKAFECKCLAGWKGEFCEEPICEGDGDCHHGYCTEPNGKCMCNHGWSGPNCTVCMPLPGCNKTYGYCDEPMECECRDGWAGSFCNIETCNINDNCVNGKCIDGICKCETGWKGERCDTCVTYPECEHGTCKIPWQCTCIGGWTGHLCNISVGNQTGLCKDGICECHVGWKGERCHISVGTEHGLCKDDKCECHLGWKGERCDISVDTANEFNDTTVNNITEVSEHMTMADTYLDMSTTIPTTTSLDTSTTNPMGRN